MVVWVVFYNGDLPFEWYTVYGTKRETRRVAEDMAREEGKKWKYIKNEWDKGEEDPEEYAALVLRCEYGFSFGA